MRSSVSALVCIVLFPALLAFCKEVDTAEEIERGDQAQTADAAPPAPPDPDEDVVAYAELCKAELGITQPLPAMSCLAGTEVPITIDGQPLTEENYATVQEKGCDKPQWLSSACHNYDFVQRIDVGNPDVDAILNCRQKYFTNALGKDARRSAVEAAPSAEKIDKYKLYTEFNDLGFILRNKKTGKSCFFTIFGQTFNGAWLAPPDQKRLPPASNVLSALEARPPAGYPEESWYRDARATYLTPRSTSNGGCIGCHDLGAFKHSPFIDQVGIVPTSNSKTAPYLLVGKVFQEAFRSRGLIDVTSEPVEGSPQRCTGCHRMTAGGNTCNHFLPWATGNDGAPRHESARKYPDAAWMPLGHGMQSAEEYEAKFGKHIAAMKCCCEKPNAKGCKTRRFGPTTEEIGEVAPGRALPDYKPAAADAVESCL
jgi:hypothetical protein